MSTTSKCVLRKGLQGYKVYKINEENYVEKDGDWVVEVVDEGMDSYKEGGYHVTFLGEGEKMNVNGWLVPRKIYIETHYRGSYELSRINYLKVTSPDGLVLDLGNMFHKDRSTHGPIEAIEYIYNCLWFAAIPDSDLYENVVVKGFDSQVHRDDAVLARMTRSVGYLKNLIKDYETQEHTGLNLTQALEKEYENRLCSLLKIAVL